MLNCWKRDKDVYVVAAGNGELVRHFCLGVEDDLSRESERSCREFVRRGIAIPEPSVGARRNRRAAMLREYLLKSWSRCRSAYNQIPKLDNGAVLCFLPV